MASEPEVLIVWFRGLGVRSRRSGLRPGRCRDAVCRGEGGGLPVELLETQYLRYASTVMPVRIDREDALRPVGVISRPASEGPDRRFNVWRRYEVR
jgi:hypothetical protein